MGGKTRAAGRWIPALKWLFIALCALAAAWWISRGIAQVDAAQAREGRRTLERALRRAAVSCYAAEGVYPPTLDYLTHRYGVTVDNARYAVYYEIFAENIMPEITVVSLAPEGGSAP